MRRLPSAGVRSSSTPKGKARGISERGATLRAAENVRREDVRALPRLHRVGNPLPRGVDSERRFVVSGSFQAPKSRLSGGNVEASERRLDPAIVSSILCTDEWFFMLSKEFAQNGRCLNPQLAVRVMQSVDNALAALRLYVWICNSDEKLAREQSIYRVLLDVLVRRGPVVLSPELLKEIRRVGCRITEDTLCVLIRSWGRLGLSKYITEVIGQLVFLGFKPTTRFYNSVIDALVKSNSLDLAYLKFQQMPSDNCHPDRFTYNTLIHGVCKLGIVDEALRLVKQMESSRYSPNVFTYTMLIDGFFNAKRTEEAFGLLTAMRRRNILPNEAALRTLVHGTFRCLNPCKAYKLLKEHIQREPGFCKQACSTVFYCLSKNNMAKEVQDFLRLVTQGGHLQDTTTFGIIMACLVKASDVNELCGLLDDFLMHGGKPGFNTYLMLITYLYKVGRTEKGDQYVHQMIVDGLLGNVVSYNMLIDCFCKAERMDKAMEIFGEMQDKGFLPDLVSFNTIINGYSRIGEVNKSRKLLKMLLEHGFRPDAFTFSSIIDGLCHAHQIEDAFDCFHEMIEWNVYPNALIYNILMRSLCASGQFNRSMNLFRRMKAHGVDPDVYSFNALILSLCRTKKVEKAQNLFSSMLRFGLTPDNCTYHALVRCLCDLKKVDEAKETALAMEEDSGCHPDIDSYRAIIKALYSLGRLQEANEFVSECTARGIHLNSRPTLVTPSELADVVVSDFVNCS